jgi:hypothetical protein
MLGLSIDNLGLNIALGIGHLALSLLPNLGL